MKKQEKIKIFNKKGKVIEEITKQKGDDFEGEDLSEAVIRWITLEEANFIGTDLEGADITGSSFIMCDFRGADIRGACIKKVNFIKCDLRGMYVSEDQKEDLLKAIRVNITS